MEKIILWGTGEIATRLLSIITDSIVLVIDNDKEKWGNIWNGYVVNSPSVLTTFDGDFDRIVIASLNWKVIRKQILEEFCIAPHFIDNMYYRQKKLLLNYYKKNIELERIELTLLRWILREQNIRLYVGQNRV